MASLFSSTPPFKFHRISASVTSKAKDVPAAIKKREIVPRFHWLLLTFFSRMKTGYFDRDSSIRRVSSTKESFRDRERRQCRRGGEGEEEELLRSCERNSPRYRKNVSSFMENRSRHRLSLHFYVYKWFSLFNSMLRETSRLASSKTSLNFDFVSVRRRKKIDSIAWNPWENVASRFCVLHGKYVDG